MYGKFPVLDILPGNNLQNPLGAKLCPGQLDFNINEIKLGLK